MGSTTTPRATDAALQILRLLCARYSLEVQGW